jgi:hypothetical protein
MKQKAIVREIYIYEIEIDDEDLDIEGSFETMTEEEIEDIFCSEEFLVEDQVDYDIEVELID